MITCEDIMTQTPFSCLKTDKVYIVAQRLQVENIGALPVVEDLDTKKLIGMITDRDLAIRVVGTGQDSTEVSVGDVMTPSPVACHPNDEIDVALAVMSTHQIRRVPIVNEMGGLVGIVTQADIATRMNDYNKIGHVVEKISQPDPVTVSYGNSR